MFSNQKIVTAVVILALSVHASQQVSELGCYRDNREDRSFSIPASDYDPASLNVTDCRYKCEATGRSYAALQQGTLCLCGDVQDLITAGTCSMPCSGNSVEICGGAETDSSVYASPPVVRGLTVEDPGIITPHEDTELVVSTTSGSFVEYSLEVQDGSSTETFALSNESSILHNFRRPGQYVVLLDTLDAEDNAARTTKIVHVQSVIEDVDLSCPEAVEINTKFECTLVIKDGTELQANIYFDDGQALYPIQPTDPFTYHLGSATADSLAVGDTSQTTGFIMQNRIIKTDATVAAWEFNVKTDGEANFQIYRPRCSTGQTFCFKSYSCIPENDVCKKQSSKWAKRCNPAGSDYIYSFSRQNCVHKTTGEVSPQVFTDNIAQHNIDHFELVHNLPVSFNGTGAGYFADKSFFALAGDMIGYVRITGALNYEDTSECYESAVPINSIPTNLGETLDAVASGAGCTTTKHMLSVHLIQPFRMKYTHNYTQELKIYNMRVDVQNGLGLGVSDTSPVDVQEVIQSVSFNTSQIGATNDSIAFLVNAHTGNKVTYNWTFGDGGESSVSVNTIEYAFTQAGVYTVELHAWNLISSQIWTETIIIQDRIMALELTTRSEYPQDATVFGTMTWLDFTISQGTNVTYEMHVGDGTSYTFIHDEALPLLPARAQHNGLSGFLGYTFQQPDVYEFNITVSNLINSLNTSLALPVQIPLDTFTILQPKPIAFGELGTVLVSLVNGTHVQFTSSFAGVETRNFSMSEETGIGQVYLDGSDCPTIGTYVLEVNASNLVTGTLTDRASVFVDYNLTDVNIAVDRPYVDTGDAVTFNITMLWGSRYTINITWDDGQDEDDYHILTLASDGDFLLYEHSFLTPFNYDVIFHFTNIFVEFDIALAVVVQNPVLDMVLDVPTPVPFHIDSGSQSSGTISFLGTVPDPTDPFFLYDYGDGGNRTGSLTIAANSPAVTSHAYDTYGSYNLTLNISNFVSFQFFERSVDVDQPMTNATVAPVPKYIKTFSETSVTVTMSWGSRMDLLWDFMDGTTTPMYVDNYADTMVANNSYQTPGIYAVSVTSENTLGTLVTVTQTPVIVQNPVVNVHLTCTRKSLLQASLGFVEHLACNLWLDVGTPDPTSAELVVDWGDGQSSGPVLIPEGQGIAGKTLGAWRHYWSFSHEAGYTSGGTYDIVADIVNLVSNASLIFTVDVYEEITGLTKNLYAFDNTTGNKSTGFGDAHNYYRLEEMIYFESDYVRGSHVTYRWDFDDGITKSVYDFPDIIHQYDAPATYTIWLNASNPLNYDILERTIVVQRQVIDIELWTQHPRPKNRTYDFYLNAGNIGTDACYLVDYGDENATYHYHFLGNQAECERSFPAEWSDPEPRSEFIPIDSADLEAVAEPNITFSNHLMSFGILNVKVTGVNMVSRQEIVYKVVVTKGPCFNPMVDLEAPNACVEGSICDPFTGYKTVYKSDIVYVDSRVGFDCEATKIAHYTWSAVLIEDNGDEIWLDLNDTKVYSTGLRKLRVNPRILPYGTVRFSLNVSMDDVIGVETVAQTHLVVRPTPLKGEIVGGSEVSRKWNINITVDAMEFVYDPDIGPHDWTSMTWRFYCRRTCESWPTFSADHKEITDPQFTTTCDYPVEFSHDRGCFRFDGVDGPGAMNESQIKQGIATIDTYYVYENDQIELMVIAYKGDRLIKMMQSILVVDGDPPDIYIQCVTNCALKVNPTGRFSMLSKIAGWRRGMQFQYWWELYTIPLQDDTDPTEALVDIKNYRVADEAWEAYASTGIFSDNMAIDVAFLSSLSKEFLYRLKVIALREGSSAENLGWGTKDFFINEPPIAGDCVVVPDTGYALDTEFNIECAVDFTDSEGSLTYDVGYRKEVQGNAISFYSGRTFHLEKPVNLPAGLLSRNHTLDVILKATDPIGSSTTVVLNATVYPPTPEEAASLLEDMSSNPEEFQASLSQSSPSEAAQLVMIYSEVINDQQSVVTNVTIPDPNDASLSEEEAQQAAQELYELQVQQDALQKKAEQQRASLIAGLQNVELPDLTSVKQSMQATQAVAAKPEQLNSDARDSMVDLVFRSVETVTQESGNENVMADDLENIATSVLESVALVTQSIAIKTDSSSESTEYAIEKTPEQIQYDEEKAQEKETEKQQSRKQIKNLKDSIKGLSNVLMEKKVPGERATILPPPDGIGQATLRMSLDKSFNRKTSGRKIKSDASNEVTLPTVDAMGGGANDSSYFYSTSVVMYADKIYAFNNQSEINQATSIPQISIMNDTDVEIPLQNMPDTIQMKLENREAFLPEPIIGVLPSGAGDEEPEVRVFTVPPNNALHLLLKRHINQTDESSNSSDSSDLDVDGDQWLILLRKGERPTDEDYDFNCTLPYSVDERINMVKPYRSAKIDQEDATSSPITVVEADSGVNTTTAQPTTTSPSNSTQQANQMVDAASTADGESTRYIMPDKWMCFISNDELNSVESLDVYITVKLINTTNTVTAQQTDGGDTTASGQPAYELIAYTSQCMWWDEANELWLSDGVSILPMTDHTATYCASNHLTSFGGGFVVPMNTIDLNDSAFLKLHENPVVFATMVAIMCLYLIMAIWARKMDVLDKVKAGSTPLLDNNPKDKYLYELVVFTGQRINAGTTSKVRFMLTGDEGETAPRLMWDNKRKVLQRKGVDSFIMAVPQPLGNLMHLRIWHDNSGDSKSWYFSRMQITDMQTGHQYFFMCDRWLAVEEDDGMIDRVVPVAGSQELTSFNHLFWTKTQKNLTDGHIWFSVFQRPPRSRFTRVQRLTCCLSLLFTSMMANILFYQQDNDNPNTQVYRIGPINFTLSMIYVGVVSGLIAFPASIIIVSLFRYSGERPSKKKKPLVQDPALTKAANRPEDAGDNDFAIHELEKQKEFLETGDVSKRLLMSPTFGSPPPHIDIRGQPAMYPNRGLAYIGSSMGQPTVLHTGTESKKPPKKKFLLPWWCVIIGYMFALATIGVAFWMTVEVAGQFGAEKSKEWLFSFMISVVESIFLSQPIKVLLMALFFSLLCRKPEVEEDDRPANLKPNEEWLHTHLSEKDMQNPETVKMLNKYKEGPRTLDEEYIKAAREERFKELKMYSVIRELLFYLLFLYLMMMVAYGNRDPWSVYVYQNHKNMFYYSSHYEGLHESLTFDKIHSRDDFWDWTKYVLLPTVYSGNYYDGSYHDFMQGYTADNQGYLIGEPRLRQLRVHQEDCPERIQNYIREVSCGPGYGHSDHDSDSYKKGWLQPNETAGETPDNLWLYRDWLELNGYPYWGKMATYAGGGFVAGLGKTWQLANNTIDELIEHRWLDLSTRAIFIEFLIYNPNINLFSFSQMLVEFSETGAGYSYFKFHVMRLNRYIGSWMFVVMASEVFTLFFIIFYMYKEIKKMVKERKKYFTSFWNVWECVTTCLCIGAIVMFFYRLFIGQRMEDEIHENPDSFHNFQYVILWDEVYNYLLGLIIFMSTAKFLKLLRFNRRMSLLTSTLQYSSKGLRSYFVMFAIVFFAFVQLAYLMFYAVLFDFVSFIRSTETMFSLMLNKFDFNKMRDADRIWAPVIVFLFTLFVSFILINIFITIVVEGYFKVKHDISMQSNEYEIVDFIMNRFKTYIGVGQPKRSKKLKQITDKKLEFDPDEYIEGVDPNAATAEELRSRVITMLDKLEGYIAFKAEDKNIMKEMHKLKQKPPRKILVSS